MVLHRFEVEVSGLPNPSELGPYDRYVAWLTPPGLDPMLPLGHVENGRSRLRAGGFNQYLFLVSAEGAEGPGEQPEGPLVLRGTSPSMVLRPHDMPYVLAEMTPVPEEAQEGGRHGPGHPGAPPRSDSLLSSRVEAWRPPPMHPQVDMPPQLMALRPEVSPLIPFPESLDGIPPARASAPVRLADGDTLVVEAGPVLRQIDGSTVPGYAYNGQIPGPRIEAEEGSLIHVRFRNETPLPSSVHWHGLRLGWRFDGAPGVTQDPVAPGGEFHYELRVPDEGTFWYHPHVREDILQDMGLAGNLRVHPRLADRYEEVEHEEYLVLSDHLEGPEGPVPYGREAATQALMGRFGNVLLVNGAERWRTEARPGETMRLHLTNAAATRTFNLSAWGPDGVPLPLRLVGSDVGALPRPVPVESAVLAPAERWVVELTLPDSLAAGGRVTLQNRVQALDHMGARFFPRVDTLGVVELGEPGETGKRGPPASVGGGAGDEMALEMARLLDRFGPEPPDHTLVLDLDLGELPFPLGPLMAFEGAYRPPVEWDGTMMDMDWLATGASVEWVLRDPDTGAENMEIDWDFQVGDRVKLRLANNRDSPHPMQHPIHLHGQRFMVLSVNGVPNEHPAWKDTVLVPVGSVVDLLVELDNPGPWMLHCHISEHLESGMMTVIQVNDPSDPSSNQPSGEREP